MCVILFYWETSAPDLRFFPRDMSFSNKFLQIPAWKERWGGETAVPSHLRSSNRAGKRLSSPRGSVSIWHSAFAVPGVFRRSVPPADFLPKLYISVEVVQLQRVRERILGLTALCADWINSFVSTSSGFPQHQQLPSWPFLKLHGTHHVIAHQCLFLQAFCPFLPEEWSLLCSSGPSPSTTSHALWSSLLFSWRFITFKIFYHYFGRTSLGWTERQIKCICSICHINQMPL